MTDRVSHDAPIGFLDSGIGGLPYLETSRKSLPNERFVYLADRANFPYGSRERDEVDGLVTNAVALLYDLARPKMVVVACNTASVVSLDELRRRFNVPFVGVVPAIKPAARKIPRGRIAVLATARTSEDPYLDRLERDFAAHNEVVRVAAPGLVESVEADGGRTTPRVVERVRAAARSLEHVSAEGVVLGCTHFVHIRHLLEQEMRGVPVFDSVDGVARQVVRVNTPTVAKHTESGTLYVTGPPVDTYRELGARYSLPVEWCDGG